MRADHENTFLISTKKDPAFFTKITKKKTLSSRNEATTAFNRHPGVCQRNATGVIIALPQQVSDIGEIISKEVKQKKAEKAEKRNMLLTIFKNNLLHSMSRRALLQLSRY